mgnify:CR=1 FL=1
MSTTFQEVEYWIPDTAFHNAGHPLNDITLHDPKFFMQIAPVELRLFNISNLTHFAECIAFFI